MTSTPLEGERPRAAGSATAAAAPASEPAPGASVARPFFSVVVPVHDGGADFDLCLRALSASSFSDYELIVVDDASADGSAALAAGRGARVVHLARRSGPAAARNRGAGGARGEYLFFLDADCEVHPDTLAIAAEELRSDPELDAVFGSYDDRPRAPGLVSQFKNLFHHWTHQQGRAEASTFWAGCGAVRRRRFEALGGFDERRYPEPSIEDIDLGYRLTAGGGRIRVARRLQVRHAKRWTLASLVRTDLLRRGAPWTELLLERRGRGAELNAGGRQRLVVAAGVLAVGSLVAVAWWPPALAVAVLLTVTVVILERGFYALLVRRCGALRALASVPLHLLYCLLCAAALLLGLLRAARRRSRAPRVA